MREVPSRSTPGPSWCSRSTPSRRTSRTTRSPRPWPPWPRPGPPPRPPSSAAGRGPPRRSPSVMRIPASTYRLQITSGFDLYAAAGRLAYLHDLGVDWVYLSPLLEAAAGSTHGYDVVDPSRVDESRGGSEGLAALSAEARRIGMGVLVDIVPNPMGVAGP